MVAQFVVLLLCRKMFPASNPGIRPFWHVVCIFEQFGFYPGPGCTMPNAAGDMHFPPADLMMKG